MQLASSQTTPNNKKQRSGDRVTSSPKHAAEADDSQHDGAHQNGAHREANAHGHGGGHGSEPSDQNPTEFWEQRYSDSERIWSGNVNRTLEAAVEQLPAGRSLDLGCGEGGDVLWLAQRGWKALGIDLSATATSRGNAELADRGIKNARFIAADLGEWADDPAAIDGEPEGFDLVTASFFQSPVELPREKIIRRALDRLTVGGSLVLLSHASAPGWAKGHGPGDFHRPEGELATLGLAATGVTTREDGKAFEIIDASIKIRRATGPDGHEHELEDSLVVVRRQA
nr:MULTISPECIES: class I SAM-dependent methyltransferase [unclassified Leucobacter]